MSTETTTETSVPTPSLRRPARARKIGVALALSVAALGGTLATASPASAASAVSFCFSFANPPANSAYANRPVYLYEYLPHGWSLVTSGSTGANGCGTFYRTPTRNPLQVRAYTATAYQTWDGWTPYYANAGAGGANLGRGNVYRTR